MNSIRPQLVELRDKLEQPSEKLERDFFTRNLKTVSWEPLTKAIYRDINT